MVAVIDADKEALTWDWTALGNSPIPVDRNKLENIYKRAVEEKKNKRRAR